MSTCKRDIDIGNALKHPRALELESACQQLQRGIQRKRAILQVVNSSGERQLLPAGFGAARLYMTHVHKFEVLEYCARSVMSRTSRAGLEVERVLATRSPRAGIQSNLPTM